MVCEERIRAVQEQNIRDPVCLHDIIKPVEVIPWIYHDDRIIVRNKVLHKAVGIRILKDQQRFAGRCRCVDLDDRMIAPQKYLILILLIQLVSYIKRRDRLALIRVIYIIIGTVLRNIDLNCVSPAEASALRSESPEESLRQEILIEIRHRCVNAETRSAFFVYRPRSVAGPVMIRPVIERPR